MWAKVKKNINNVEAINFIYNDKHELCKMCKQYII